MVRGSGGGDIPLGESREGLFNPNPDKPQPRRTSNVQHRMLNGKRRPTVNPY